MRQPKICLYNLYFLKKVKYDLILFSPLNIITFRKGTLNFVVKRFLRTLTF